MILCTIQSDGYRADDYNNQSDDPDDDDGEKEDCDENSDNAKKNFRYLQNKYTTGAINGSPRMIRENLAEAKGPI